jgi:hypothetical protein
MDGSTAILAAVLSFVGSVPAVFMVLLLQRSALPSLRFEIEDVPPLRDDGRRFLRVWVRNRPGRGLFGFLFPRQPALMCRAAITFLHENGDPVFRRGHTMRGKWANTPEPSTIAGIVDNQMLTVWDLTRTRDVIDIPPGGHEVLDVVMRPPGQDECLGWHNAFIDNPNLTADQVFQLPRGRYHAFVRAITGGRQFSHVFRIVNDLTLDHFRLEDVRPQPRVARDLQGL